MKRHLKSISLLAISGVLIMFLTFSTSPFLDNQTPQLLAKANIYNMQFPQEKVYLHLDRSSYWASEDIWFKAYLKDSPIPDCNLYVELLNASGRVIHKKMYWVQGGLAYGDFHLTDTIPTGVYQIRAYTNWMRNFDDSWFFRKDLVIWNLKDKKIDKDKRQLRENKIDFQFFPEGGTFITGIKNKVAFKATDQNGKGLDAEGRIVDDLGNIVVDFKSDFKGIGSFMLQPKEGRSYEAKVKIAGQMEMRVDLPVSKHEGVTLNVNSIDADQLHIQMQQKSIASPANFTSEYTLVGQTKGGIFYRKNIAVGKDVFTLEINKQELPTGIVQFTLFDQDAIPVCERLVFINHHDYITIGITPNKTIYLSRERVQLNLEAFDREGTPFLTNLSLSVFNPESQLKTEDYPNNILTHFLLGTELKGLIEDPGYYFKDDSLSTMQALDNLLLTHGYRHFEWEAFRADHFPQITYPAEECLQVKGTVKTSLLEKPVSGCKVTLMSLKGKFIFNEQTTDSLGKFLFSNLYFNDTVKFILQAKNKKGKQNGYIELDKSSSVSPPPGFLPVTYQYSKEDPMHRTAYLSEVSSDFVKRKWRLSDTIMLNEVRVIKSKYKFGERPMRLYEKADYELDLDTDDDELGDVLHKLEDKFPDVVVREYEERNLGSGSGLEGYKSWDILGSHPFLAVRIDYQKSGPVYVIDGSVVDEKLIHLIPAGAFKRVEILKNGFVYSGSIDGGAICFFTKRGAFAPMPNSTGMKRTQVLGYSVIRKFYSPNYEFQLPEQIKDDFRSTLYWNPIVRTDSLGRARVSFFNSDQAGEVQLVVEGVTKDGKLCRGVGKYKVVSKE